METRPDEAPWACNLQGLLLLARGEDEAALAVLRRGFEADPGLQSPVTEEFMTALVRTGRTDEAIRIVDAASSRPLTASQRTRIGWCNVMLGRYRVALRQFRRVLALRRRHVYATYGLAFALWRLHRPARGRGDVRGLSSARADRAGPGAQSTSARSSTRAASTMPRASPTSSTRATRSSRRRWRRSPRSG